MGLLGSSWLGFGELVSLLRGSWIGISGVISPLNMGYKYSCPTYNPPSVLCFGVGGGGAGLVFLASELTCFRLAGDILSHSQAVSLQASFKRAFPKGSYVFMGWVEVFRAHVRSTARMFRWRQPLVGC